MEQKPTEGIGTRRIPSLDDVEGHAIRPKGFVEDQDVEGHMPLRRGVVADEDSEDVEGHMPFRRTLDSEEDIEGHGLRGKPLVADEADDADEGGDDDVEGHGAKVKI